MADNADEELDSSNQTTEEVAKTDEVEETDDQSGAEDLEALQEKNKRLFERAKKAEAEAKILKAERLKKEEKAKVEVKPPEKQGDITVKDSMALINAKVTEEEDIDSVVEYAQFKKIPVSEALKSSVVKTMLAEKAEFRKTAQATATGPAKRGSTKPTADVILENVAKGKLPDDAEDYAEARFESKKKK